MRYGWFAGTLALLVTSPARGTLYHPEYLRPHHGVALIDCDQGFERALRQYFLEFAPREGIVASGTVVLKVDAPSAPITRFTATFADATFRGFIYVDPTLTMQDAEPWEDEESFGNGNVCSASFVDGNATAEEVEELQQGWRDTVSRLYFDQTPGVSYYAAVGPTRR